MKGPLLTLRQGLDLGVSILCVYFLRSNKINNYKEEGNVSLIGKIQNKFKDGHLKLVGFGSNVLNPSIKTFSKFLQIPTLSV